MIDTAAYAFIWPAMLWLLLSVPLLVAGYILLRARREKAALRVARLMAMNGAVAIAGRWAALRRNLPVVLMLLALCALILAVARPQASLVLPVRMETVILAMDVSGSMRATDIAPNRLAAAQRAAKSFVDEQPGHVRIGIVAIAAAAAVAQSPTLNREDIFQAIDRFQLQRGTALGSGLVLSLATVLPGAGIDVEQFLNEGRIARKAAPGLEDSKAAAPGSYGSAAIVLLSDGQSNTGPDVIKAAEIAARHGVRVYTVGVGTSEGATLSVDGWSMRVRLDEETLKKIATLTGGDYFRAGSATDLKKVYQNLSIKLALEKKQPTEITAVVAAIGAALAMTAALLSLLWFNRIL